MWVVFTIIAIHGQCAQNGHTWVTGWDDDHTLLLVGIGVLWVGLAHNQV